MDILKLFLIGGLIIGWTSNPYFKKKAAVTLNGMDYFIVNMVLTGVLTIPIWIYLVKTKHIEINVFKKMSKTEINWSVGAAIITVITSIMLIYLVKNYEVSSVIPQIQPVVIMLSVLMGAFMFGESLSTCKIIGVCLIIGGMVVINMGKLVKVGKRPWKLGA
jgi:uncharacterized membrane protein